MTAVDEEADAIPEGSLVWFGGTDTLPAGWVQFLPPDGRGERAHRIAASRRHAERMWDAILRSLRDA